MDAVPLLQELIRFDTTNPPGNEQPAAEYLHARLTDAGLKSEILTSPGGRPNVVARTEGPQDKEAIVLLSHLDVVGVESDRWRHDPFGGEIHDGELWGRGALDMKGIAAMHACAAATLVAADRDPRREVIVVSVADEEAGGVEGAQWLLKEHADKVGFSEGRPPPEVLGEGSFGLSEVFARPVMPIVLGEKAALWLNLIAHGAPGHGALPPKDQAALNLAKAVTTVAGYATPRIHPVMREQFSIFAREASQPMATAFKVLASPAADGIARVAKGALAGRPAVAALLSDTIATTQLSGGYKHNVVPGEARAALDCRLLPDTDVDGFIAGMRKKLGRLSVEVEEVSRHSGPVSRKGPMFEPLARASLEAIPDAVVVPSLTAGITDVRFFRARGANGYGWVPLVLSAADLTTIHGHDERVNVEALEKATAAMSRVVLEAATSEVRG